MQQPGQQFNPLQVMPPLPDGHQGMGDMMLPQSQMMRKNGRRGNLGGMFQGKSQPAAPDGYYCYYPELFEK